MIRAAMLLALLAAGPLAAQTPDAPVAASARVDWNSGAGRAILKDLKESGGSRWKQHIYKSAAEEEYCSLSFGFAAELKADGYKGVRVGTKTLDLTPANGKR